MAFTANPPTKCNADDTMPSAIAWEEGARRAQFERHATVNRSLPASLGAGGKRRCDYPFALPDGRLI
jgi:hypothetical protein